MKILRLIATLTFSLTALFSLFGAPVLTHAADDYGLSETASQAHLDKAGSSVPTIAGNIIGTALSMISVIFFILMVYGGFLWMTAHGDEGQISKAQETIIGAIIGIIIILASYAITSYITNSAVSSGGGNGGNDAGANLDAGQAECNATPHKIWDPSTHACLDLSL